MLRQLPASAREREAPLLHRIRGGANGLSATPFHWPGGSKDVLLAFSLAVLAFGGFEAAGAAGRGDPQPRRNVPLAVVGAVIVSGIIYGG